MVSYLLRVLIGLDLLVNSLLAGSPYETLSGRAWRMHLKGQPYWGWTARAIDTLFFWQPDHCRKAYENELQASPQTRAS